MGRRDKPISSRDATTLSAGERLRYARQEKGISLSEMALKLSFSKGYLSGVENNSKPLSKELVRKYENELGLKPGELSESSPVKSEDYVKNSFSDIDEIRLKARYTSFHGSSAVALQPSYNIVRANKPWRVMIVDDHEIFRHGLRNMLNDTDDFDVVAEASLCGDVLKHATKMPIDLVLMDASLPDAVSIEAIERLRELTPPPQVVLLSTTIDDGILLDAILAGASGYLTKDLPKKDVVNALQSLQRGELALLPPVAANVIRLLTKGYMNLEKRLATERQSTREKVSLSPSKRSSETESPSTFLSPLALHRLTSREYKVFQLLCQGLTNKEIAAGFSISPYTVGKHVQQILRKLGAVNRTQAVLYATFQEDI